MASLKLVDNVPGVDYYEYRDIDFFNKFKYRVRLRIHGLNLTYYAETLDEFLRRLDGAESRWRRIDKDVVKNNLPIIEKYLDFKKAIKKNKDFVIRIEGDTAGIFSNDLNKLQEFRNIPGIDMDITEAITSAYAGVKYFVRQPKHQYRVYFKSIAVEPSFIKDLREVLSKNKNLYPSKGLVAWLYKTRQTSYYYRYCSSSFSVDYDDESQTTYLALMLGDKLGNRYKLEKRPDPT